MMLFTRGTFYLNIQTLCDCQNSLLFQNTVLLHVVIGILQSRVVYQQKWVWPLDGNSRALSRVCQSSGKVSLRVENFLCFIILGGGILRPACKRNMLSGNHKCRNGLKNNEMAIEHQPRSGLPSSTHGDSQRTIHVLYN